MKKKICFLISVLAVCVLCLGLCENTYAAAKKSSIKLNKSKATIYLSGKKTVKLKATVKGPKKKITWKSSNKKVATVNSKGKVTAKKAGIAKIIARSNGVEAKCTISVKTKKTKRKQNISKRYYSYDNIGLDYKTRKYGFMDFYSDGENGYEFVLITSFTNNQVKYRKLEFKYNPVLGHYGGHGYGKTYTAKLVTATKYYNCVGWQRIRKLKATEYEYGSKEFKKLKILKRVEQKQFCAPIFVKTCFIKLKKGKVVSIVHPVILADI